MKTIKIGQIEYPMERFTGYWKFDSDEQNWIKDLTGNGNQIKLGNASLEDSPFGGKALKIGGETFAVIQDQQALWGANQFTINFWIRYESFLPKASCLMSKQGNGSEDPCEFRIIMNGSDSTFHDIGRNSLSVFVFTSNIIELKDDLSQHLLWTDIDPAYACENWEMLSITYNGNEFASYVNGVKNNQFAFKSGKLAHTNAPLILGYDPRTKLLAKECLIDELFIAKIAFKEEELKILYNSYEPDRINPLSGRANAGIPTLLSKERIDITELDPLFVDPSNEYRQIQYSMSHTPNMADLIAHGVGGVVLSAYHKDYLNENYDWTLLINDLKKALAEDFQVWLYDEDLYPTGGAGGLTCKDHSEYQVQGICEIRTSGTGIVPINVELHEGDGKKFVAAVIYPVNDSVVDYTTGRLLSCTEDQITGEGIAGDWILCGYTQRILENNRVTVGRKKYWAYGGRYPSLINPLATKRYFEVTHQQYKDHFDGLFERITAFYTGEPASGLMNSYEAEIFPDHRSLLAWDETLPSTFLRDHGYDVAPYLGEIFNTPSGQSNQHRYHYYQTIGNMMAENFFGAYVQWCEINGAALSGHLLFEEELSTHVPLYGNFIQCMSLFQIPGLDYYVYNHGIEHSKNLLTLKFSLSGSRHRGNYIAQGLFEPIVSGCYFFRNRGLVPPTLTVLRNNSNQMFAGGVSIINKYGPYHEYDLNEYKRFTDYTARLCYLLRDKRDHSEVAIYYNIETLQARYQPNTLSPWSAEHHETAGAYYKEQIEVCKALLNENISSNYLDTITFDKVLVDEGALHIANYAYTILIIPSMDLLPLKVLRKIVEFERQGGLVIWLGDLPFLGDTDDENFQVRTILAKYHPIENMDRMMRIIRAHITSGLQLNGDQPDKIYYSTFVDPNNEGRKIYLIVNESHKTNHIKVNIKERKRAKVYEPLNGQCFEVSLPFEMNVEQYSAIVVTEC